MSPPDKSDRQSKTRPFTSLANRLASRFDVNSRDSLLSSNGERNCTR